MDRPVQDTGIGSAAQDSNRRDGQRHMTVYRSAKILVNGRDGLCLIRNISDGGLMGMVHADFPVGTPLLIEIGATDPIRGKVAWARDKTIGVQFDTPIRAREVLNSSAQMQSLDPAQRTPRLSISCPATLLVEGEDFEGRLVSIWQGGASVESDLDLRNGQMITLKLDGLDSRRAVVRSTTDRISEISFHAPLSFDMLGQWAMRGVKAR